MYFKYEVGHHIISNNNGEKGIIIKHVEINKFAPLYSIDWIDCPDHWYCVPLSFEDSISTDTQYYRQQKLKRLCE